MSIYTLEFEKPLREIEDKIDALKNTGIKTGMDVSEGVKELELILIKKKKDIYNNLTRWERVQLARHPKRPCSMDYITRFSDYWFEIHGDRYFADDPAMICGLCKIEDFKLIIIAQEKGRGTKSKLKRNFGMARPEGYRKAIRIMKIAEKYNLPIVTLIDTPGAYPGVGAEERGQAQAIANNLFIMSTIKVPILNIVIGEGASGGALGIGLGDKLICFENTWYSVISPEGCASILFRDSSRASEAADSMMVTANDLKEMNIADLILSEPDGSAHVNYDKSADILKSAIIQSLIELKNITAEELINARLDKYNNMGKWIDG